VLYSQASWLFYPQLSDEDTPKALILFKNLLSEDFEISTGTVITTSGFKEQAFELHKSTHNSGCWFLSTGGSLFYNTNELVIM